MTKSSLKPKNWPQEVQYLTSLSLMPSVDLATLRLPNPGTLPLIAPLPAAPSLWTNILPITDPTHPAFGQNGLFATRSLSPGSFILFYLGLVHTSATTDPASDYDLSLDREHDISIDATRCGNEARFINDYRGVRSEGPNAEFRDCAFEVSAGVWEKRIGVFVLDKGKSPKGPRAKGIAKGQEIVVSYGKGFWNARHVASELTATVETNLN
ncbi:hypothetical protein B0A52_09837 [Exophiala mesophila]|uniref:SET domain-containing protein n=1 Tax=Exophiala mesophila TaxID=212818 RepID=A0A438MQS1_EXOME|nr:hypothetical protein B0A52_09837 [Exophiala mesophila]